jgi:hypothetical protein
MILLSHVLEGLHLLRCLLALSYCPALFLHHLSQFFFQPSVRNLQPPLFSLTAVHLIWDDSRARKSPEKGGLGYELQ